MYLRFVRRKKAYVAEIDDATYVIDEVGVGQNRQRRLWAPMVQYTEREPYHLLSKTPFSTFSHAVYVCEFDAMYREGGQYILVRYRLPGRKVGNA